MKSWELLGEALSDYFEGDPSVELLVESDCAGLERMPAALFFRNFDQWSDLEQYAVNLCLGRILDIGAGAGSHSLELQERGFEVYPIDIAPQAVAVMRERGLKNACCADFASYQAEPFDTILMLMNGIGVVGDLARLGAFLERIGGLLKPGGQILADSSDLEYLRQVPDTDVSKVLTPGPGYGRIRYSFGYRGIRGEPFDWLFLDEQTLKDYAGRAGWDCQVLFCEDGQYLARLVKLNEALR